MSLTLAASGSIPLTAGATYDADIYTSTAAGIYVVAVGLSISSVSDDVHLTTHVTLADAANYLHVDHEDNWSNIPGGGSFWYQSEPALTLAGFTAHLVATFSSNRTVDWAVFTL